MYDLDLPTERPTATETDLAPVVCWSRMQAEAGQQLEAILRRKEAERLANGGIFFWGVGNPPARSVRQMVMLGEPVDAVFSVMKSRPKAVDLAPARVALWQTYFDENGAERMLPRGTLVTSRADSATGAKPAHYALMCASNAPLRLADYGPFDHSAYRNVSVERGPVGASQVTALVERHYPESRDAAYRINMRATLTGSYWVKLGRPLILSEQARQSLDRSGPKALSPMEWIAFLSSLRDTSTPFAAADPGNLSLL